MSTGPHAGFPEPVVITGGNPDPTAPLVVLLHGRGSDETSIAGLVPHLPAEASYASVRAPLAENGGYAWFENRGIGRPVAESLRQTMDWFTTWLDEVAPAGRHVILVGFSGGAAFAGGLLLDRPDRYDGAAILYGTLPFDAGVPVTPGRLAGIPVLVAQGTGDTVIPRELLDRTWHYLTNPSGAPAWASRFPGGHGLTRSAVSELATWLARRLAFLAHGDLTGPGPGDEVPPTWLLPQGRLPERAGPPPEITTTTPQEQLTQNSPPALQEQLFARLGRLAGVHTAPSAISVPGARAFTLSDHAGPAEAFLVPQAGEFAHLHPAHDGSLHLALPPALAKDLVARGWGAAHPLAGLLVTTGFVMVFGPRTEEELDVVAGIVATSHAWARDGSTIRP